MPRSRERYYEWPLTVFLCSNLRGEIEGHIYIRVTFTCPSRVLAQNNVGLYCNREQQMEGMKNNHFPFPGYGYQELARRICKSMILFYLKQTEQVALVARLELRFFGCDWKSLKEKKYLETCVGPQ